MKLSDILLNVSVVIMIAGLSVFAYYLFYSKLFFSRKEQVTPDRASSFGDFINGITGPLFALAGFLIIYATIIDQREVSQVQQFENSYFKFLDYHRDNNQKFIIRSPKSCNEVSGRQVWVNFWSIYKKAYTIVDNERAFSGLNNEQRMDIGYAALHFGLGSTDTLRLFRHLDRYGILPADKYRFFARLREVEHCESVHSYFFGFSNILDNYFNEYFTYLKYVDECDFISQESKSRYVSMLISQNDNYCTAVQYAYIHSSVASESDKDLAARYGILSELDSSFISPVKN